MIRELRDDDVRDYVNLRREALLDAALAVASSPADDLFSDPEAVREQLRRAPEFVIFGAFDNHLVGAVGLYREPRLKSSHKAHLWGLYLAPGHRRQGLAFQLLDAAVRHARALRGVTWVLLSVASAALGAQRLYERAGFHVWGTEPEAFSHEGHTVVKYYMALRL